MAILIGIVIGMGIFRAPSLVADQAGHPAVTLALWGVGGLVSLFGALTYAELAAAYPDKGGELHFLQRAFGRTVAFLFGWARLTVIQTGTIAGAGFVLGDYLTAALPLGPYGSALIAAAAVGLMTAVQLRGRTIGTGAQRVLTATLLACLLAVTITAVFAPQAAAAAPATIDRPALPTTAAVGLAMVFVLLTFGGWNEAAYLSGEFRRPQSDATVVLLTGVALVTLLYLGVNWAYLHVLGYEGVRGSKAVGFDAATVLFGPVGGFIITAFVVGATLSTINGTLFTGGRSGFALGRDFKSLAALARWDAARDTPTTAILAQGLIGLALVGLGAWTQAGFETMVAYTAPVFWAFIMLTALAHLVLRVRDPNRERPFRTPLFPAVPLLFAIACGFMAWSSIQYALSLEGQGTPFAVGVGVGVAVGAAGLVAWALDRFQKGATETGASPNP